MIQTVEKHLGKKYIFISAKNNSENIFQNLDLQNVHRFVFSAKACIIVLALERERHIALIQ